MTKQPNTGKADSPSIESEREKRAIARCLNMVDYISEVTVDIIMNCIENNFCSDAKQFLIARPEEFAVRSFEKAIYDMILGGPRQGKQPH